MTQKIRALFILLVGLAVIVTAGFWLRGEMGWRPLPAEVPQSSSALDPAFEDAGRAALDAIEAVRAEEGIPGVTAAVAIDGTLVWVGAAGWSDLEAMVPMTPDSVMRIGSTSKAMTATLLARLHDRGSLSMSDSVGDHTAEPLNPDWSEMTLSQLMSHTAGMPGYEENTDWLGAIDSLRMKGSYKSVKDGLRLVDDSRLLSAPGDAFHYSSFDVNLAAFTAECATGSTFAALIGSEIRTPLKLGTPQLADSNAERNGEASYYRIREGGRFKDWGHTNVSQRWPGGGLMARSSDLVQVASAWLDSEFITPETRDLFWTPVRLNDGSVNEQNYAMGWRVDHVTSRFGEDREPLLMIHHGGVSRGAMSWLTIYPQSKIAVAVNINTNTPEFGDFARVEADVLKIFSAAANRIPPRVNP